MLKGLAAFIVAVRGAFVDLSALLFTLVPRLIIPSSAIVVLSIVSLAANNVAGVVGWLISIANIIAYTIIAVTTHRIILIGLDSVPSVGTLNFSARELKFAITLVLVSFMAVFPSSLILFLIPLLGNASYVSVGLFMLMSGYLLGRFSLALPSIAIGEDWSLKDAFILSKPYQFALFLVCGVAPTVLACIAWAITVPVAFLAGEIPGAIFGEVISIPLLVIEVAILSKMFAIVQQTAGAD